ncbi:MAG: ABC transporter ATP-binding protein [Solirubrobacterales bacterium]
MISRLTARFAVTTDTVATPPRLRAQSAETVSTPGPPGADSVPLALIGVHKRWRGADQPVLTDVELRLDIGTSTWIGGRNGAGKTTLLRVAAGLIQPDRGRVQAWGSSPRERRANYHRLVAFLPAGDRGLYARLTVRQQLGFWAGMTMLGREEGERRIEDSLRLFDLGELADRRVDRMSMGQRQRVRLAMTFLPEPETVLLDEPLTSLDGEGAALLEDAVAALLGRGGALLWCSPSGDHPERRFDSDWLLEDGRLVSA